MQITAASSATAPKDTTKYWGDAGTNVDINWAGSGTEKDPYLITSAAELAGLSYRVYNNLVEFSEEKVVSGNNSYYYSGKHFRQTCNIDVSDYWWTCIGIVYKRDSSLVNRFFAGVYNGGGYTVSGVFTKAGDNGGYGGNALFGVVETYDTNSAEVKNLGVVNSYIQGRYDSGGIVAICTTARIQNCYFTGDVQNTAGEVGGIAAEAYNSTITNCYTNSSLSGSNRVGGIVGLMSSGSMVNCFALGSVSGTSNVGQIVGANTSGEIYNCMFISGTACGSGSSNAWAVSDLATQAKEDTFYTYASNWNSSYPWDFNKHWTFRTGENDGYAVLINDWRVNADTTWQGDGLTEATAYIIDTPEKLAGLSVQVKAGNSYSGKYFKQTVDISLGGYEWAPIGFSYEGGDLPGNKNFEGVYDGNNHVISGMNIENLNGYNGSGLFASVKNATLKNIVIKNATVGKENDLVNNIGTLAGWSYDNSLIENCHVSNTTVYGNNCVGGLIGRTWVGPTIKNCTFNGYVHGEQQAGGITGYFRGMLLENCYSSGNVVVTGWIGGGIVGYVDGDYGRATIRNCVFDGVIEGTTHIGSLVGWFVYGVTMQDCAAYGTIRYFNGPGVDGADHYGPYAGGIIGHILVTRNSDTETYMNIITNCSFVGECNTQIAPFFDDASTGYRASNLYSVINGKGYYSNGDFSDWAVISGMNKNLPMQKALYAVAKFGEAVDATWFDEHDFVKA